MTGSATVVGGGPAGLMAAQVLAERGVAVTVYEHMPSPGRKLLLAGRGGLNITHGEVLDDFLARYGDASSRLESAIREFPPADLRTWCASLGETTFVGSSGRVFPASFRATPLLRAWLARLTELGVTINTRHRWIGWGEDGRRRVDYRTSRFERPDGEAVATTSDVTVFALGGATWPRVGSDGGWVAPFRNAGIEVNDFRAANCGIEVGWTPHFAQRFAGTPLKNVAVSVGASSIRGDAMVTDDGLEGGPVYAHSAAIRRSIDGDGRCTVTVDLHPDLSAEQLTARLTRRRPKDSVASWLRHAIGLTPVAASLLREASNNHLPADAASLAALVKAVPIVTRATMPIARAISSAGGVSLAEVDDSFMLHRVPGTFVTGEMLDWEAPTGGYLLQASFSTAVAAARGALTWMHRPSATAAAGGRQ
ncbi:MAG: TIGR03862 family flavoprotein [Ilumatobacteraceae bacterium]